MRALTMMTSGSTNSLCILEVTWFKRAGHLACSRFYLLALRKAEEHKQPVPHVAQNDNVYRALLGMEQKTMPNRSKAPASSLGPCPDDSAKARPRKAKKVKSPESDDESGDDEQ